ncbi:Nif3-like dinuclear metal center hexameric protein [Dyadobacter chenwenxiniae]|uniref:GTP cyclohydrolase 1 type 2 homolog n=1 Tax=Dyadobacter chenwenxiniae TaxID=2906456 RepID=A0A9X1PGN2_9BACT|nr:Nif3-like dinuclear metal center hexameric protein [Dyadobacter chenwenxiniae]MCF0060750.1 Nif3-like dinuclear metal center hexameric protein [Dyadobacter chenwenxiniae]UON80584.1 Nif3-like dinuclear metal center hexameric protein [Dyadobacter chenwenxiniae]
MTLIKEVINALEQLAPPSYQESYDNAGLIVGSGREEIAGVLLTLDVTEDVVQEAIDRNCNLIVAHHPIVFKGLKKLNGKNYVERTVLKAIKNDIAIYATHTNLDHVTNGVNWQIASLLGLNNIRVLAPKKQILSKLTFFSPVENTQSILNALHEAGAGNIGNYSNCSFRTEGTGTFLPNQAANPVIGKHGQQEEVKEHRAELIFPSHLESIILNALRKAHPYEEVAYYLQSLENENQEVGAGACGELPEPLEMEAFLRLLKDKMQLQIIKHTKPVKESVQQIAVCGGAGSFLLPNAVSAGADVFITADYKYHEFFDAENNIMICDIGHYESEVFTKNLLHNYLSGKFPNFALCLSEVNTNPVRYFV